MSPGKKSPSSSLSSSPGCSEQGVMLSLHSPHTQDFTRCQKPRPVAQGLYCTHARHSFGSCPAFLDARGGLVLWLQAAWDTSPSLAGESTTIGVQLAGVPTRTRAFCPNFRAVKLLHLKLFCLQTLKLRLQTKQAFIV